MLRGYEFRYDSNDNDTFWEQKLRRQNDATSERSTDSSLTENETSPFPVLETRPTGTDGSIPPRRRPAIESKWPRQATRVRVQSVRGLGVTRTHRS